MKPSAIVFAALSLVTAALVSTSAHAQAPRTWVSGVGDDVNPCSRTAPCKTFAGAISKTQAGGQITVLDPGGYGAVTITKAISIIADTALGGINNASISGIIVNAGAADEVLLRGLVIDGTGTGGTAGVRFLAGKALTVTDCIIRNQTFASGNGAAIELAPTVSQASVVVSNCTLERNKIGIRSAPTAPGKVELLVDRVRIENNSAGGIASIGNRSAVRVNASTIVGNTPGLISVSDGRIASFGNNVLVGNDPNGAFTEDVPLR
jgi:hypothetical protein